MKNKEWKQQQLSVHAHEHFVELLHLDCVNGIPKKIKHLVCVRIVGVALVRTRLRTEVMKKVTPLAYTFQPTFQAIDPLKKKEKEVLFPLGHTTKKKTVIELRVTLTGLNI
jgi:hypothetical protein